MVSTRSKTGALPTASKTIDKARPSRHPKGKKGTRVATSKGKAGAAVFLDNASLLTDAGVHVSTASLLEGTKGIVLFTYPRANTPGCTTQACNMRDASADLKNMGYNIWGLSYDKPKSQAGWKAKHSLEYGLLCDTLDIGVIKALRAHKNPKGIVRSVFVVRAGKGGPKVVFHKLGVSPKDSVPVVKAFLEGEKKTEEKAEEKEEEKKDDANGG
ncbi:unnamed protein product [Chondrus crispus]|uniref:thioredoxin-dependent peroxiredoxin n=1 Tax=Chondrus crispus TaxID=2769 RepID=R7Q592_CHOCR|nr:unnamed protein product [Chondrus crispus]CDF32630.1 unnamed protein product [Chondrus crispus]|eukprot:XP_005712401.1 unnamed protein product [Chondrus crispus]